MSGHWASSQSHTSQTMIVDLSSPSVNDGIPRDWASLQYASIDDMVQIILSQWARNWSNWTSRCIPQFTHSPRCPDDFHLLVISWDGAPYIDGALPQVSPTRFSPQWPACTSIASLSSTSIVEADPKPTCQTRLQRLSLGGWGQLLNVYWCVVGGPWLWVGPSRQPLYTDNVHPSTILAHRR